MFPGGKECRGCKENCIMTRKYDVLQMATKTTRASRGYQIDGGGGLRSLK